MIEVALAQATNSSNLANETGSQIAGLFTYVLEKIPLWIAAIIVIVFSFVVARIVKASVENRMALKGFEEEHHELQIVAGRTANAAVLIVGITVALKIAGIDLTAIIAAGAFGVGFALKDLIMNFIAGVMILSARHLQIGDVINVDGTVGKIEDIQTRATILKAFDGTKIVVPNSSLFKNQVVNFSCNPFRKITIEVGVDYKSDLKKTMEIILTAVRNTQGVLIKPKPSIFLTAWEDYYVNFKVKAWVETKGKISWVKVKSNLMLNIDKALADNKIEIPYPISTVYLSKQQEEDKLVSAQVAVPNESI